VVSLLCVAERADAASRRWKPAVLVVPPDVNPSSPSSIGGVASISGQAAVACGPDAPVGFPWAEWPVHPSWIERVEPGAGSDGGQRLAV
jgi:hypothetical protein